MAKKNQVFIDVVVDDKGTTKRVAVNAKKLGIELERSGAGADRASRGTDKLSKNTKELDRNMKGASKQSANSTKNFSKMSQGMGGLVGAYATLAAQVFAVSAAFQFLSEASQLKNLIAGQEALGASTGVAYKTITTSIVQATDAQLKYADAAKAAAIGTAAGLTSSQLTDLGTAAKNASFALGRDLTDSFNRLVRGVTKAEPELLDELGIILRLETATRKYALEIGKSVGDLNAFERTQAVTNDVLDQATSKFAAIEEQMDPSAAALAQFTKSFDTLLNSFKTGVLDAVLPVLEFLTKNTMGLVAALALVGVPILKAILPSMSEWEKASKKQIRQSKKQATAVEEDIKKQKKAILDMVAAQKDAAAEAKNIVMGKGTKASAGLDFLTGAGEGTKTQQAAASKILKNANDQMMKFGEVRSGALKGYLADELAFMQASYDKRVGIAQTTTSKISNFFKRMWMRITLNSKRGLKMWKFTMGAMATAAKGAAKAINVAMSAIAIVGIIALILSAAKELYRYFFPLSELEKENIKIVEELTNKYKDLTAELKRSASARDKYLTGSAVQANEGRAVQSADPDNLIREIDKLANVDPDTEGLADLKKELLSIVDQLAIINPKFEELKKPIRESSEVGIKLRDTIKLITKEAVELSTAIESLPRVLQDADKAFDNMMKGFVKPTPLTNFLDLERKAVDVVRVTKDSTAKDLDNKAKELSRAATLMTEQQAAYDRVYEKANTRSFGKYSGKGAQRILREGTQEEKDYVLKQAKEQTMSGMEGFMNPKQIEQAQVLLGKTVDEMDELTAQEAKREARLLRLTALNEVLLNNATKRTKEEIRLVNNQFRGITLQGKIKNLELDRFKINTKVAEAQDKYTTALALHAEAVADDDETRMATAKIALDNAEAQRDLAVANAKLAKDKINFTQKDIELQIKLLKLAEQQRDSARKANALREKANFIRELGGGSFSAAQQAREVELAAHRLNIIEAEQAAEIAATKYMNKFKELVDAATKGGTIPLKDPSEGASLVEQAGLGGVKDANAKVDTANREYQLFLRTEESMKNRITADTHILKLRSEARQLDEVGLLALQMRIPFEQAGITLGEKQLAVIRNQAKEQVEYNHIIEAKQAVAESITGNMESAFNSIVDGSKSAKQAFKDMAKAILADIAKMIVKLLIQKAIMAAMGMADGGVTPSPTVGAAKGGVFGPLKKNSYTSGGIARGPNAGYAATLHGNEAVVPLPHNRKIPVEMKGSGSQQNNVTVNVSMGNGGGSAAQEAQADSNQANQIGDAIAKAVQAELQYQKRSGGILNPYGVA